MVARIESVTSKPVIGYDWSFDSIVCQFLRNLVNSLGQHYGGQEHPASEALALDNRVDFSVWKEVFKIVNMLYT